MDGLYHKRKVKGYESNVAKHVKGTFGGIPYYFCFIGDANLFALMSAIEIAAPIQGDFLIVEPEATVLYRSFGG